jgi:hypothetical protein
VRKKAKWYVLPIVFRKRKRTKPNVYLVIEGILVRRPIIGIADDVDAIFCLFVFVSMFMCVFLCLFLCVSLCICVSVCQCVCVCVRQGVCVCMYVYVQYRCFESAVLFLFHAVFSVHIVS